MNTYIDASETTWERFWRLLDAGDPECTAYVYRVDVRGCPVRPFWLRAAADHSLVDDIQARGGGRFRVIVRRGRHIVFAGYLAFAART